MVPGVCLPNLFWFMSISWFHSYISSYINRAACATPEKLPESCATAVCGDDWHGSAHLGFLVDGTLVSATTQISLRDDPQTCAEISQPCVSPSRPLPGLHGYPSVKRKDFMGERQCCAELSTVGVCLSDAGLGVAERLPSIYISSRALPSLSYRPSSLSSTSTSSQAGSLSNYHGQNQEH